MKKYLLRENGNFYKANLHTHSTLCDGKLTPQELKEVYQKKGYSVIAFSHHDVMIPLLELADENFLPLTSAEIYITQQKDVPFRFKKTYHLCLISKNPHDTCCPVIDASYVHREHQHKFITEEQRKIKLPREYSVKCAQKIIDIANENGYLVTLNHPVWSLQNHEDYASLKHLFGVEVYNTSCVQDSYFENTVPLQTLLKKGENVFPICADDAHTYNDCGGGFLMIKADELTYDAIYQALKRGDFYASSAPEIYELYIENGSVVVKTSKAKSITLLSERRFAKTVNSPTADITETRFDVSDYIEQTKKAKNYFVPFIRIEVTDHSGNKAYTRGYRLDELL